jgi:hypothetical protein
MTQAEEPLDDVPSGLPAAAASLALAVALPWMLVRRCRAAPFSVVAGAAAWGVAVAVKRAVAAPLRRRLAGRPVAGAAALGALSAATELSASQAWLGRRARPQPDLLAFGAGAAGAEAVALIVFGAFGERPSEERVLRWAQGARRSRLVRHALFAERLSATIGHIASRSLLALGVRRRRPVTAGLPILLFAVVDGVASYGDQVGWDWSDPTMLRRFHAFLAAVDAIEMLLLAYATHLGSSPSTTRRVGKS